MHRLGVSSSREEAKAQIARNDELVLVLKTTATPIPVYITNPPPTGSTAPDPISAWVGIVTLLVAIATLIVSRNALILQKTESRRQANLRITLQGNADKGSYATDQVNNDVRFQLFVSNVGSRTADRAYIRLRAEIDRNQRAFGLTPPVTWSLAAETTLDTIRDIGAGVGEDGWHHDFEIVRQHPVYNSEGEQPLASLVLRAAPPIARTIKWYVQAADSRTPRSGWNELRVYLHRLKRIDAATRNIEIEAPPGYFEENVDMWSGAQGASEIGIGGANSTSSPGSSEYRDALISGKTWPSLPDPPGEG
jgi:hypothetical protein